MLVERDLHRVRWGWTARWLTIKRCRSMKFTPRFARKRPAALPPSHQLSPYLPQPLLLKRVNLLPKRQRPLRLLLQRQQSQPRDFRSRNVGGLRAHEETGACKASAAAVATAPAPPKTPSQTALRRQQPKPHRNRPLKNPRRSAVNNRQYPGGGAWHCETRDGEQNGRPTAPAKAGRKRNSKFRRCRPSRRMRGLAPAATNNHSRAPTPRIF